MDQNKKYRNYLKALKSKTSFTQHDYEIASELLQQTEDPSIHDEVESIMDKMNELVENSNSDRMPL
ncbi:hypothetical protein [Haloplasma contractile]|uniref:Uncharacterized protein n=1 Tax=Haloplasma contractile SSD-17B TaxID=1033810 RepID=U2FGY9_9MOLU|nr:hypothetical protein [Haloplasma contractile]ERJ12120.1 hypothetical protein HLPCO_001647 [Haloplasma contractile SSD-17B]